MRVFLIFLHGRIVYRIKEMNDEMIKFLKENGFTISTAYDHD